METLEKIYNAVLKGSKEDTEEAVQAAIDAGVETGTILGHGLIMAMAEVGRLFEAGEYYVPQMLIAARAMQSGLNLLRPLLVKAGIEPAGRIAIGTVKGDLHDIGKNLVAMMLEGSGFEIVDLGTDTWPARFVEAAKDGAQIVAMSALLTTTMPTMKETIEALKEAGLRDKVKVIVGGAPITQSYADGIGADGYAPDAASAVRMVKQLSGLQYQAGVS